MAWLLLLGATLALLAGCGSEPKKRVFPPDARIQQLEVASDGNWRLTLRVHNYSNVPMRFARIDAELAIDDRPAGTLALQPQVDVAANSVELLELAFSPSADAAAALRSALDGGLGTRYRLHGTITASEPRGEHEFDFASRLDPAPGLAGVLR